MLEIINQETIQEIEAQYPISFIAVEMENEQGEYSGKLSIGGFQDIVKSASNLDNMFFYFVFKGLDGNFYDLTPNQINGYEAIENMDF